MVPANMKWTCKPCMMYCEDLQGSTFDVLNVDNHHVVECGMIVRMLQEVGYLG